MSSIATLPIYMYSVYTGRMVRMYKMWWIEGQLHVHILREFNPCYHDYHAGVQCHVIAKTQDGNKEEWAGPLANGDL